MAPNARRTLFIKKEFQARVILTILLCVFIFANVTLCLLALLFARAADGATAEEFLFSGRFAERTLPALALVEAAGLLVIAYVALYVSHRMAGPIHRIETLVDRMTGGDFSAEVKVRRDDEFQDLARRVDAMAVMTRERFAGCEERAARIEHDAGACGSGEAAARIGRLAAEIRDLCASARGGVGNGADAGSGDGAGDAGTAS